MLLEKLSTLPKEMFDRSSLSIQELSQASGIECERLQRLIDGKEVPTFEDVDLIKNVLGISDEMIADILEN